MPGKDLVPRPVAQPPAAIAGPPWPEQQVRSESAVAAMFRWARRNRHLTVPLAVPPALWVTGYVLHGSRVTGYVLLCGLILAGCIWFFAPHKWDRPAERWYARLSAALGAAWLWLAAWLGPMSGTITASVLGGILGAGTGTWGFFWWRHKRPRGMRRKQKLIAECDTWWQSHCFAWNLAGSRVIDAEVSGVTLRMRVKGLPGRHTIQHFRQVISLIESAADGHADIGLVRVEAVRGHPSEVDVFLKRENPLREAVEYDVSIMPQSVHEPMAIGRTETGQWKMLPQRANCFVIGATRTGKSNHLLVRLAALSGCPDDRQILIDLKGGRSARPVLKAGVAEHVVTEVDEARMTLRMLVAEGKARAKYAYDGNEQLLATEGIPGLHLLIDETHGLTSVANGDSECAAQLALVSSLGSGLEVYVEVYTQFGSLEESVRTEQTRGNLTIRVCYRVEEARHGQYVIPEYHRLDASQLEEKGTCYIKDGPRVFAEQVRGVHMPHSLFLRIAAQNAALLGERSPLYLYCGTEMSPAGVTWQEWWDTRWLRLDPAFHADSPQYRAAAARYGNTPQAEAAPAPDPVPSPAPGTGDAASAAARLAEDDALTAGLPDGFRPDPRLVAALPAVIATQQETFADVLQSATAASPVTPKDLASQSGRGRTWVHDRLSALVEGGFVTQVGRGQYVVLPGRNIRDGLAEIEARNEQLAREARQLVDSAA